MINRAIATTTMALLDTDSQKAHFFIGQNIDQIPFHDGLFRLLEHILPAGQIGDRIRTLT